MSEFTYILISIGILTWSKLIYRLIDRLFEDKFSGNLLLCIVTIVIVYYGIGSSYILAPFNEHDVKKKIEKPIVESEVKPESEVEYNIMDRFRYNGSF